MDLEFVECRESLPQKYGGMLFLVTLFLLTFGIGEMFKQWDSLLGWGAGSLGIIGIASSLTATSIWLKQDL